MSKIYAALVSTFTASEIYAQDSVQRCNKGGMAESVASTKTGKNGERRNPTDNYPGRLESFGDICYTLDTIIFAV